jgi:hypothetical protein
LIFPPHSKVTGQQADLTRQRWGSPGEGTHPEYSEGQGIPRRHKRFWRKWRRDGCVAEARRYHESYPDRWGNADIEILHAAESRRRLEAFVEPLLDHHQCSRQLRWPMESPTCEQVIRGLSRDWSLDHPTWIELRPWESVDSRMSVLAAGHGTRGDSLVRHRTIVQDLPGQRAAAGPGSLQTRCVGDRGGPGRPETQAPIVVGNGP